MKKLSFLMLLVSVACTACMNMDSSLRRESARVIGGVSPDEVTVYDVDRGMMDVNWKAKTSQGDYICSSDDMMRKPFCTKKK